MKRARLLILSKTLRPMCRPASRMVIKFFNADGALAPNAILDGHTISEISQLLTIRALYQSWLKVGNCVYTCTAVKLITSWTASKYHLLPSLPYTWSLSESPSMMFISCIAIYRKFRIRFVLITVFGNNIHDRCVYHDTYIFSSA